MMMDQFMLKLKYNVVNRRREEQLDGV